MAKNDKLFDEIKTHANDLKSQYSKRNTEFETYERMYLLEGSVNSRGNETVKVTTSPSAHNKVLGAERLLQSQDVRFDCKTRIGTRQESEHIEKLVAEWWKNIYSVSGKPIKNEIIHSAALYSDVHIGLTFLEDYEQYNPEDPRIKYLKNRTPVLFECWNPRYGYPEKDALGLSAYYQELKVNVAYIRNVYGKLVPDTILSKKDTTSVTLKRFWDLKNYCIWVDNELLDLGEHGLPCIPVSVSSTEGSNLFEDAEDTYQPLLFGLARSGLWERENLTLTTLYTNAAAIAFTPSFKWKTDSGDTLRTEISDGVQYYRMAKGDDIEAITNKGVYTNEINNIVKATQELVEQTTVHDSAFGASGGGSSFSESTLLAQASRLPLVPIQKTVGLAIGDIMQKALDIMRERGINFNYGTMEIKGKDIPEDLIVEAKLDIILPQERTQMAATAATILANGLASKEWVRSEVMGVPNNEEMEQQIAQENVAKGLVEYYTAKMMQDLQMSDQQQQQANQQQFNQQIQRNEMANMPNQMDMGGMQNIPVGVEQQNPRLADIQNRAMENNVNRSGMPQVPEGTQSNTAGIAGGMPSEMMGLIPGVS